MVIVLNIICAGLVIIHKRLPIVSYSQVGKLTSLFNHVRKPQYVPNPNF